MPLVAAAGLAYVAGLLAGFGGAVLPGGVCGAVVLGWGAWRRDARIAGAGLLAVAGIGVAWGSARQAAACVAGLARAASWTLTLEDLAVPGVVVPVTVDGDGCRTAGRASVLRGAAQGGDVVTARGLLVPAGRVVFIRYADLGPARGDAGLVRLRSRARRSIDATFRGDAALARALLIADARTLPADLRDRFADAGLVHLLSISGLHVAIIAAAMQLVFQAARLPRTAATVATVAATGLYVAMIGAPPPAVRSGTMLAAAALSRLLQRPTSPWATIALGALVPLLLAPATVLDLGYQLSVAGIVGLAASGRLARRTLDGWLQGWRRTVGRELLASVVASLVTLPLVAWTFGRVSVVAPVANLAAGPVVTLLQPALFLALLCAPVPTFARFVADATHPLLWLLDQLARAAAMIPHASVTVAPTFSAACACGAAAAAFVLACTSRRPARPTLAAAAALAVLSWLPALPTGSGRAELHMIDVGQGDAVALRTPRGKWVLFDAGPGWRGGDAGRSAVIPYLRRRGGPLAAFVLSHPHLDHVGGAVSVIEALRPRAYWDAAFAGGGSAYRASLTAADAALIEWHRVHPGDTFAIDGVKVTFLAPDSAWTAALRDPNEASTVALVRYGAVRFLLVGDAERGEEAWLLQHADAGLRADVLKVGHHGSRTSSTGPFLAAVRPRVALVSVGLGNSYGHPDAEVLGALAAAGAEVVRTDLVGSAVVRTDGRRITLETNGIEWPVAPDSSPAPSRDLSPP